MSKTQSQQKPKLFAITVGVSGSGKSRLGRELELHANFTRICPDDIRKELTGDISDQSQNGRVWKEAYARVAQALQRNEDVIFDSIATTRKTRNQLREAATAGGAESVAYLLMDSLSEQRCRDRVAADITRGVMRSNTLADDAIITRQHQAFLDTVRSIEDEGFAMVVRVG